MPTIPRDLNFDSTVALLIDPYEFVATRRRRYESDLFQARLLLRDTICMIGAEAAQLFYDESRFVRHGASPGRMQDTLFGRGGVQSLDGDAHRHRKQMFMSLMTPDRLSALSALSADLWRDYARKWAAKDHVVLYDEVCELLTQAVCAWAGIRLDPSAVKLRTRELTALFESPAAIGPKYWWGRLARRQSERWIEEIVGQVRAGQLTPPEQSAVYQIAMHRDLKGELLSPHVAAVEVLNVLRPTVAIAVFIVFVAHALHRHPACRERLLAGEEGYLELFVQEVRRYYPFFPSVLAVVRHDFDWKGYRFPKGRRVLLDLYGTNHDPRIWEEPYEFQPERFRHWDGSPFNFIPQGGGDYLVNHRCAGEWITIDLMKVALRFLAEQLRYDVPEQDLRIDWTRLPALPRSHFKIRNVRLKG